MHVLKCDFTSVSFECLVFRGDKDSCGPDGGHGGGHPVHRRCLAGSAGEGITNKFEVGNCCISIVAQG